MSNTRSVDGSSMCFGIDITQDGTYTVTCVNNDDNSGEVIYTKDIAEVESFMAGKARAHFAPSTAQPLRS